MVGWFGKHNIGDESYKLTFPNLFSDYDFTFSDKVKSDVCILGGGNILSDSYVKLALKSNAERKMIFSASANKLTPFELLKNFDKIVVRDKDSHNLLLENNIDCFLGADAAFSLVPNPENGKAILRRMFDQEGLELYSDVVGVVLNGHLGQAKDAQLARDFITLNKASQDIASVADSTPASFVFFPMSTGSPYDDRVTNGMISNRCKFWKKNLLIHERLSVQDTLDLISALNVVISTRLHSSIFSLLSNVPFIDLVHHDKNACFLKTCGLEEFKLSYWSFGSQDLKLMINKMLSCKFDLIDICNNQKKLLEESVKYVFVD